MLGSAEPVARSKYQVVSYEWSSKASHTEDRSIRSSSSTVISFIRPELVARDGSAAAPSRTARSLPYDSRAHG